MMSAAVVSLVLLGLQLTLQTCVPGELRVTGGGVVVEDQPVTFTLCLAENSTCTDRDR